MPPFSVTKAKRLLARIRRQAMFTSFPQIWCLETVNACYCSGSSSTMLPIYCTEVYVSLIAFLL
jgi:hypothetical protein